MTCQQSETKTISPFLCSNPLYCHLLLCHVSEFLRLGSPVSGDLMRRGSPYHESPATVHLAIMPSPQLKCSRLHRTAGQRGPSRALEQMNNGLHGWTLGQRLLKQPDLKLVALPRPQREPSSETCLQGSLNALKWILERKTRQRLPCEYSALPACSKIILLMFQTKPLNCVVNVLEERSL